MSVSACPICGATSLGAGQSHVSKGHHARTYTLLLCRSCGVQHWSPLLHPGAAFYEDEEVVIYRALHDGKQRVDDPRFDRFFREFPNPRGLRVLDVGCSDGAFLSRLHQCGNEVWGIDIDMKALEVARRRGLDNVRRAEVSDFVESAKTSGLTFDLITAFDVLEHLIEPSVALEQLASILKPGARLVGTVPNRRRILANAMPIDFPPHHFYRFDTAALEATLTQSGLAVEHIESFQYGYSAGTVLAAILRPLRSRRAAARDGSSGEAPARGTRTTRRMLKRAVLDGFERLSRPVSYVLERPGGRGFKLFFVARSRR